MTTQIPTVQAVAARQDQDRTGARDLRYDVAVIGAGVGGLTAGALLARSGSKVLVVEAAEQPGGYAAALRRENYVFDRADHLIFGCGSDGPFGPGPIDEVLRRLGVGELCEFIRMDDPVYVMQLPDLTVRVPHGREAYLEAHVRHFPGEASGLRRLAELSAGIARETSTFPVTLRAKDLVLIRRHFPLLFRYRNATMKDLIDQELTDPRLKALYAGLWSWVGPPPSRASFVTWASMMGQYIEDGAYYCRGSFQSLADALVAGLTRAGGELVLGTRVTGVRTERGRIRGVELDNGQCIEARWVISDIDARETLDETMLGAAQPSGRYRRRLRGLEPSNMIAALYAATDLDVLGLGSSHDTTVAGGYDPDAIYRKGLSGEVAGLSVLIPTLKDAALAPPGQHLVILKASAARWPDAIAATGPLLEDRMFEVAERVLPGLRDHLTYIDTPAVSQLPGSPHLHLLGPYSGWAATPEQSGLHRLAQRTPVRGLLLAGAWTRPGHGVWTVVRSGMAAADFVLNHPAVAAAAR
jgi:prolycopene isomerase